MSSKTETAYDLDNTALLNAFSQAAAATQFEKSRSISSVFFQKQSAEEYLFGVVLARLEGIKPPMNTGDIVQNKRPYPAGEPFQQKTVDCVYYMGGGEWQVSFEPPSARVRERSAFGFGRDSAKQFEPVATVEPCSLV
ncbi:MAG: hypothetical protein WC217_02925 [Candidatus Paceibacterota bacterium]